MIVYLGLLAPYQGTGLLLEAMRPAKAATEAHGLPAVGVHGTRLLMGCSRHTMPKRYRAEAADAGHRGPGHVDGAGALRGGAAAPGAG